MDETQTVQELLSSTTGAPFRVDRIRENRLLLRKNAVWFVWCGDFAYAVRTKSLKAAWKDKEGGIWLESSEVADMIALVEHIYGERGIHTMPDLQAGIPPSGELPEEVLTYPNVVKLLRAYEDVVAEAAKAYNVELKLLYDGGTGVTTVRIGARIASPVPDEGRLWKQIVKTAAVLKEVYRDVLEVKPTQA